MRLLAKIDWPNSDAVGVADRSSRRIVVHKRQKLLLVYEKIRASKRRASAIRNGEDVQNRQGDISFSSLANTSWLPCWSKGRAEGWARSWKYRECWSSENSLCWLGKSFMKMVSWNSSWLPSRLTRWLSCRLPAWFACRLHSGLPSWLSRGLH